MSEEGSLWIGLSEKLFGLLLVIVSALLLYFTVTSLETLGVYAGLFAFLGVLVLVAGVFLIIVKSPD